LTQETERRENLLLKLNAQRRLEELLNDRDGMLGNRLGDPNAQAGSARLPLTVVTDHMALKWLNSIPEVAQQHRKPFTEDHQMGPGVAAVGGGSFCSMQLISANAQKDKSPAAKVPGLRDATNLGRAAKMLQRGRCASRKLYGKR